MKTIDLTPTWETAARIYIEVLENGETEEGKQAARDEIMRMAKLLDDLRK